MRRIGFGPLYVANEGKFDMLKVLLTDLSCRVTILQKVILKFYD